MSEAGPCEVKTTNVTADPVGLVPLFTGIVFHLP